MRSAPTACSLVSRGATTIALLGQGLPIEGPPFVVGTGLHPVNLSHAVFLNPLEKCTLFLGRYAAAHWASEIR